MSGRFCLVLHTHMPYVEGYGTWPFGEEWLWEAMATSGAPGQLGPLRTGAGPLLVPIDRAIMDLVWHASGYPSHGAYRDTRRYTEHRHTPWAVDGAPYDPVRAARQVRADAEHFVSQVARRIERGGLCVCALDTELLGHFWHEGVDWLAAVIEACDAAGVALAGLDEVLAEGPEPVPAPACHAPTSWGNPRDLSTWSGPVAGELAWRARAAELRVLGGDLAAPPGPRALRELLALQASDWAFGVTRGTAGPYSRARADGHAAELERALADPGAMSASSRNLAPSLDLSHP